MFHGEWHPLHVFGDGSPCDSCQHDCLQTMFTAINRCDDTSADYLTCAYRARAQESDCKVACMRAGTCDDQLQLIPPPPSTCLECTDRVANQLPICQSECDQMYPPADAFNAECRARCDDLRALNNFRCFEYGFCRR
jgi:hypothetical protein